MSDSKAIIDLPKGDDSPEIEKTTGQSTKSPEQKASIASPAATTANQATGHNIMGPTTGQGADEETVDRTDVEGSVNNPIDMTGDDDA